MYTCSITYEQRILPLLIYFVLLVHVCQDHQEGDLPISIKLVVISTTYTCTRQLSSS